LNAREIVIPLVVNSDGVPCLHCDDLLTNGAPMVEERLGIPVNAYGCVHDA